MDRDEILANFQACTGIDDVGECINHLDATDWNLIDAVNRVMPRETQTLPSEAAQSLPLFPNTLMESSRSATSLPPPVSLASLAAASSSAPSSSSSFSSSSMSPHIVGPLLHPISASNDIVVLPSTSNPRTRLINFSVDYEGRVHQVVVADNETVGTIKTILQVETGIPPCRQELSGWKNPVLSDHIRLSTLNLPKDVKLSLSTPYPIETDTPMEVDEDVLKDRLNQTFRFHIVDKTNKKTYDLNFPGNKTITQIKQDVFALTDIPVRHQVWSGWPEGANITLAKTDIDPATRHQLTLQRGPVAESSRVSRTVVVDLASDSSGEEFEDASDSFGIEDEIFMHEVPAKKLQPLMLENCTNELEAANHFLTEFETRYGENHALFYVGTLDDALKEAFQKPAKERKLLAMYLHHDNSVLSNVFCTQLLCAETVSSYLSTNFITWAWDMTFESNRLRLLAMFNQHFGNVAAGTIRNLNVDQLPILLVIRRIRSTTEVSTIVHDNVSLDELMTRLIHSVEIFTEQQQVEIVEEDEREARELVKREQDDAYEASLMADRAKEEARKLEEEIKMREEKQEAMARQKQQEEREFQEAQKTAIRQSLEQQLPEEPAEDCQSEVSCIRVRLPTGEVISRRFLATTQLSVLLNYLTVKGYCQTEYKVLTSWPRRDLTVLDSERSLKELKLYPQETLTLEER